jgi:hypothetical protein
MGILEEYLYLVKCLLAFKTYVSYCTSVIMISNIYKIVLNFIFK